MRPHIQLGILVLAIGGGSGCNEGDVTKGNTVPPIAGIVGGPDTPDGSGDVAVEVRADEASAVPGTQVVVVNLSREVDDEVATVPVEGAEFLEFFVQGDVGDELEISLTHPEEGEISREYEVTPPQIHEVRDPEGPDPVIRAGVPAQITGSGFCVSLDCNTIFFDGAPLPNTEEARPGLLYFMVPGTALPGPHTVRVAVAGDDGTDDRYVSEGFTVTLVSP